MAVFLGSDGMDDSFGEDPNLVNFYIQVVKMLVADGKEATIKSIESDLPQLSKIGSKDDMSVAFIYNIDELKAHITDFIQYQIDLVKVSIRQINDRIKMLQDKLKTAGISIISDEKSRVEIDYARQDIQRANENRERLLMKYNLLDQQLAKAICELRLWVPLVVKN